MACCRTNAKKEVTFAFWFHSEDEKTSFYNSIKRLLSISPFQASLTSKLRYVAALTPAPAPAPAPASPDNGKRLLAALKPPPKPAPAPAPAEVDKTSSLKQALGINLGITLPTKTPTPLKELFQPNSQQRETSSPSSPTSYATYLSIVDALSPSEDITNRSKVSAAMSPQPSNSPQTFKLKNILNLKSPAASTAVISTTPSPSPQQTASSAEQKDKLFTLLKVGASSKAKPPKPPLPHPAPAPVEKKSPSPDGGEFLTDGEISKATKLKRLLAVSSGGSSASASTSASASLPVPIPSTANPSSTSFPSSASSASSHSAQHQANQLLNMFKSKKQDLAEPLSATAAPPAVRPATPYDSGSESIAGRRSDSITSDGADAVKSKARLISPSDLLLL